MAQRWDRKRYTEVLWWLDDVVTKRPGGFQQLALATMSAFAFALSADSPRNLNEGNLTHPMTSDQPP